MVNPDILPDYYRLKATVLNWLKTMKVPGNEFEYKFSPGTGSSLFTTCFALYILDLFRETDKLTSKKKVNWANYINSFQREEDGLFYPDPIYHPDKERAVFQVSCFCISALCIIDAAPRYRLAIVDRWITKSSVEEYLLQGKCHLGKRGSGNKAMFQAIFLTYEYERTNDERLLKSINNWFDFHDSYQNKFGFWGTGSNGNLYGGLQNAFHQFIVYDYWNRKYCHLEKVAQTAILLQDRDGFFSNLPGGSTCKDYDSIYFLLSFCSNYSLNGIEKTLEKVIEAILSRWNLDGGFCENTLRPFKADSIHKLISFTLSGKNNKIRITRGKHVLQEIIKPKEFKIRNWVKEPQLWGESTLWDTWFHCLSIADIACFVDKGNYECYRFHKNIGIGTNSNKEIIQLRPHRNTSGKVISL